MAITYTWSNADETQLKYVDDSTTPDTVLFIPVATDNRHYQEYLTWVAAGNTASAYVAPAIVTPAPTPLELLTARVTAIESNEVSDDATDASLLTLIADLASRVTALES